jgi:hypothetical protein
MLRSVTFAADGSVVITQQDGSCECTKQAAEAEQHIEKVTRKLQYLCCDTCSEFPLPISNLKTRRSPESQNLAHLKSHALKKKYRKVGYTGHIRC